ncbi:MAG: tyrosine--tRNA ligase [Candidatus Tyloplasma litorale]|nr:MAG: tyrosine--tRNA ligase [Mycoplasmatales bacterium]
MKWKDLKSNLSWRGLLKDIANEDSLKKLINNGDAFYIGIDPTSDSIHIGHFLSLSLVKILSNYGLKPIIVLGGFTGMIGDPSGKNSEREIIDHSVVKNNVWKIGELIKELCEKMDIKNFEIFDNNEVYENLSIISLYQKYGKLFNINTMLAKESVKNRINQGISYTEFSYQLFQAIDFLYLFENKNVKLQLGGSDQWGNITAGIDLIRKFHGKEVDISGITINLLTDENGNKIGKTSGKPIWLDIKKTSSYELFQFLINQTDDMAQKLLLQATSITEKEFNEIKNEHQNNPKKKLLQNDLAKRFISIVHSLENYEKSFNLSKILFNEDYEKISKNDLYDLKNLPSIQNENKSLMDLLIEKEYISSRRQYREFLNNGSIKLNGKTIQDEKIILKNEFYLEQVCFINIGKKKRVLIWNNNI